MKITDFSTTKRGQIALFVDGTFAFSVHPDVFAASGLSVGTQVEEAYLEELKREADFKRAKEKALDLLSYKAYTTRELEDRLRRTLREADPEIATQAVERMGELGLMNDEDYARRYARDLSQRKRYGLFRVKQEMRRKGLTAEQIEDAVSLLEDDPEEQIRGLLLKKYPLAWEDEQVKRRAFGALTRMGYASGDIRRVLRTEQYED